MEATLSARELIQLAVNGEKASYVLYRRAALVAGSKKVKKIFNRIARDELVHLFTLLRKFERLYPELGKEVVIIMPLPEEAAVKKLAAVKESPDALRCVVQEEQRSLEFYLQVARVVEDEDAKIALRTIIRGEANHIRVLSSLGDKRIKETVTEEERFH